LSKVISLCDKLEKWNKVFDKEGVEVFVSSRGRMKISGDSTLTFMDSVLLLKEISKGMTNF
jgi:hypothetical protein